MMPMPTMLPVSDPYVVKSVITKSIRMVSELNQPSSLLKKLFKSVTICGHGILDAGSQYFFKLERTCLKHASYAI